MNGEFVSLDGALREPIVEVTGKLGQAQLVGTGSRGPNPDGMRVNTFGCQIAQVAVDAATGEIAVERIVAVHDIGRVISPLQARSQVEGGVLQGLGFALMEERVVDPTTGTVVNGNLEDYKLPTHADCPEIVVEFIDKPDPHASTLGLKGLGEPPIVPTAPAIANAVFHATGVRVRDVADHAPPLPRGTRRMSAYVRPGTIEEALALLDAPGAQPLAGGTDLVPLQGRGKAPGTLVDVRGLLSDAIERKGDGLVIGAATRVADVAADARDRRALRRARAGGGTRRVAAAAQPGHGRGQPRPARALLVLPPSRPDLLAGRRRHLLRPDRRPPQARPRGRGLHLGRALRPRRRAARARRAAFTSRARPGGAACPSPSSTRGRARTTARPCSSPAAS